MTIIINFIVASIGIYSWAAAAPEHEALIKEAQKETVICDGYRNNFGHDLEELRKTGFTDQKKLLALIELLESKSLAGENRAKAKEIVLTGKIDNKTFDDNFIKIGPSCLGFSAFMLIRDIFSTNLKISYELKYRVAKIGERLLKTFILEHNSSLMEALYTANAAGYLARAEFLATNVGALEAVLAGGEMKRADFAKKYSDSTDGHQRIMAEIKIAEEIKKDLTSVLGDFKIKAK